VDHLVNKSADSIDADSAKRIVAELAALGNKSIMFCGNGEPLLNPAAADIIAFASQQTSASVTTNGLPLSGGNLRLIDGLEWIRFSVNGGDRDDYAAVHGAAPEMFDRVMKNIAEAVERKRKLGLAVVVGVQFVLLEENAGTAVELARRLKDIGVDYFSVKPYSQHPLSENRRTIDYKHFAGFEEQFASLEDDSFKIIYRSGSMEKLGAKKPYGKCYGAHFLSFISANGDVWECNVFVGDRRFFIGNARQESMQDIWTGSRRKVVLAFIENELNLDECRDACRMDECNKYLWRLKHPLAHDNFI
jgi:radical SAM protein with 4Fe4S-binding SPASM domain